MIFTKLIGMFVTQPTMTVAKLVRGEDETSTIVFVHGAGGSAGTWMMQLRGLSDRLRVVALELNGHGDTPDREPEDVDGTYLEDIKRIVREYQKPILAGHSMGGALAQLYALKYPDEISGLVLIGTGAKLKVHPNVFDAIDSGMDKYLELVEQFMFSKETDDEVIQASLKEIRQCPRSVIRRDFEMCNNFDIMNEVSQIDLPTLILVGADDLMTPPKYAKYLHENIPNSEFHVIDNAGHGVMVEQPSELNSMVMQWTERILNLSD
ncbi:MAG: alpha/beta fold hydrolase [Candidatus Lokiarchaeota archaeon]|nr:alpha/beta fold hydrolase [Candidatus Lokiarchaeota archaeon]